MLEIFFILEYLLLNPLYTKKTRIKLRIFFICCLSILLFLAVYLFVMLFVQLPIALFILGTYLPESLLTVPLVLYSGLLGFIVKCLIKKISDSRKTFQDARLKLREYLNTDLFESLVNEPDDWDIPKNFENAIIKLKLDIVLKHHVAMLLIGIKNPERNQESLQKLYKQILSLAK